MSRTYLCPDCDGYGEARMDALHAHDPAHDSRECFHCDGTGVITADADTADARSLQPWTGSIGRAAERIRSTWTDPLHDLARSRKANPKSLAYLNARTRAMSHVSCVALLLCEARAMNQAAKRLRWVPMEVAA